MRFLANLVASLLGTLIALGLALLLPFFIVLGIITSTDKAVTVADESILIVELAGPVPETAAANPWARTLGIAPAYSLRDLKQSLEMAARDDSIAGVWLQLEAFHAPWATLQEIRAALAAFQQATDKPLIASGADYMMTEGAYFVATAADAVYASPAAFFTFNGFHIRQMFFAQTLDMLHIDPRVIRAGKYKSAVEPFIRQSLSPANEQQLTALLQSINRVFMSTVSAAREIPVDRLQHLASEDAILTAEGAYKADLIDGLLYRDEVADLFRQRLDAYDQGEALKTIALATYTRVPPATVGAQAETGGRIAIVYATGAIVSGEANPQPFSSVSRDVIAAESFVQTMQSVRANDSIDATVIRINSPGGSAAASNAIWRAIKLTSEQMPVIVSMADVAASGGYWIATAADAIVAKPLTMTGSIGVFGILFDASGLFNDWLGVTFDGVRTSPYANLFSFVRPLSEAEVSLFKHAISDTYHTFLEKVAASRDKLTVEEVHAVAQGRIWSGEDALDVGLVDKLGGLEDALLMAADAAGLDSYDTVTYPRPGPFFVQLIQAVAARANMAWTQWTTSAVERHFLQQRRRLRRLARSHGTIQARLRFDLTIE